MPKAYGNSFLIDNTQRSHADELGIVPDRLHSKQAF